MTSTGAAYTTGQLRDYGGGPTDGFAQLEFPSRQNTKLSQISSGRSCVIGLDDKNQLWKWHRNNKAGELVQIGLPQDELHKIRNIRAGWTTNSVYIDGYGICVGDLSDLDEAKVPGTNGTTPAYPESPTLEGKIGKVVGYIILENHLLFLSDAGALYAKALDRDDPPLLLPTFSSSEGQDRLCYLSGSFRNFAVFNKSGLVLLGKSDQLEEVFEPANAYAKSASSTYDLTTPLIPKKEIQPIFEESLQRKDIIKISFGDYHALALTQSGKVLSWGNEPQSSGCFGIGPADSDEAKSKGVRIVGSDARLDKPVEVSFLVPDQLEKKDREKWTKTADTSSFFAFNIEAAGWHSGALVSCPSGFSRVYSKLSELPAQTDNAPPASNSGGVSTAEDLRRRLVNFGRGIGIMPQPRTAPSTYDGPTSRVSANVTTLPPRHPQTQEQSTPAEAETLDENYVDPDAIGDDDEMNYDEISDDDLAVQNHALHPPQPTRISENNNNNNNPPPPQPGAAPAPHAPSSSSSHPNPNPNVQYAPDNAPRYEISDEAAMNPFMMPFIRGGLGPVIPQGNGPNAQPTRPDGGQGGDRYGHSQGNAGTDGSA